MDFDIFDLGLIDYEQALMFQKDLLNKVTRGFNSSLILCNHNPVITAGRSFKPDSLKVSQKELLEKKISFYKAERGGDITYHGPGQLVVYPIVDLSKKDSDLHGFLRWLEGSVIDLLSLIGITGCRKPGFTGVWVGEKKICSIGIAVKNWVSYHGLSLIVKSCELINFSLIKPCGLEVAMTSVESQTKRDFDMETLKNLIIRSLSNEKSCLA